MNLKPISEVRKMQTRRQAVGARRLRRFNFRVVLGDRGVQAEWTWKRPEGRAPVNSVVHSAVAW